jgi:hypothetical protein
MKRKRQKHFTFARICLLAAMALLYVDGSPASAADPGSFSGEWISRSIEGAGLVTNDPGCAAVTWTDRKIKLEQIPGNPNRFRGEWVRKYQSLWMGVHGDTCRFQGETTFVDSHIAVLGWTLTGAYDPKSDRLRLSGAYNDCTGNVCPQMQAATKDFNTELGIVADDLVDADPALSHEEWHHFISNASELQRSDEVMRALKPMLDLNDKGDFDGLYRYMGSIFRQSLSPDQFRANAKTLRTRTGQLLSRSPMSTMYANYNPSSKSPGQNAIVMNVVYFPGNVRTIEYVILTKESGEWKMNYYYLGGGTAGPPR